LTVRDDPSADKKARAVASVWTRAREVAAQRPPLRLALRKDAARCAAMRGERHEFGSRWGEWMNVLRLSWASDDYLGVALYRIRMAAHDAGVPVLPTLLHRLCIAIWGIRIGPRVAIKEGLHLLHGTVVIDGITLIGEYCTIAPFVTIGLKQGNFVGPTIEGQVFIGTGARVIGGVTVGRDANIGAGAVVVDDVAPGVSVAGVPARPVSPRP
jgi:serine O-acetyltransferase